MRAGNIKIQEKRAGTQFPSLGTPSPSPFPSERGREVRGKKEERAGVRVLSFLLPFNPFLLPCPSRRGRGWGKGFFVCALLLLLLCPTTFAQTLPLSGMTICIDPGHTSETSAGTQSRDGKLTERHINWIEAVRLRALLTADGVHVVMTKATEAQIVTNRRRAEIANAAHASLLLRLHCDSNAPSGITTYYPDRQGTRFGVTGPSRDVIAQSHAAAMVFQPVLAELLRGELPNGGVKGDSATFVGGKQGALTGSIFAQVPALTVEMCVLTNAHDYTFIRTANGQAQMAYALYAGVIAFEHTLQPKIRVH